MRHRGRSWELRKKDILESISDILKFMKNVKFGEFEKNREKIHAVVRCLEIIGEAAKYAPKEIREKFEGERWQDICDMRNRITHEYFDVDVEIVWEVVQTDLQKLEKFLEGIQDKT